MGLQNGIRKLFRRHPASQGMAEYESGLVRGAEVMLDYPAIKRAYDALRARDHDHAEAVLVLLKAIALHIQHARTKHGVEFDDMMDRIARGAELHEVFPIEPLGQGD